MKEAREKFLADFKENISVYSKNKELTIRLWLANDTDMEMVTALSITDQQLGEWCADPSLNSYWNYHWSLCSCYPTYIESKKNPQLKYNAMKPQPGISSYMLVCGQLLYNQAKKLILNKEKIPEKQIIETLYKAIDYGSFAAFNQLNSIYLDQLNNNQEISLETLFSPLLFKAAELHRTPVYLSLALTAYTLGCYYGRKERQAEYTFANKRVLSFLDQAILYESKSEVSIHNAYYGRGLQESNPFKINNIAELREQLLTKIIVPNITTCSQEYRFSK